MREKPICDRVPVIVMPVCPKAVCHMKPVSRVTEGEGCCEKPETSLTGSQRAGGMGRGGVPEPGGGMSEAAGDRGRGVVDGRIPSMRVGCTF